MPDQMTVFTEPTTPGASQNARTSGPLADFERASLAAIGSKPVVVGLIGAIGAGKSTVAKMMAEQGCRVFDADKAGHEALQQPEIARRLVSLFGNSILDDRNGIDRSSLARIVFADPDKRRQLEGVTHPVIRERFLRTRDECAERHEHLLVLEAPVLLEAGWRDACNLLVFIDAPFAVRLDRVRSRGWTEADLAVREAAQLPNDQKRAFAHWVIANDGSLDSCRRQVNQFLELVRQRTSKESFHG